MVLQIDGCRNRLLLQYVRVLRRVIVNDDHPKNVRFLDSLEIRQFPLPTSGRYVQKLLGADEFPDWLAQGHKTR